MVVWGGIVGVGWWGAGWGVGVGLVGWQGWWGRLGAAVSRTGCQESWPELEKEWCGTTFCPGSSAVSSALHPGSGGCIGADSSSTSQKGLRC